MQIYDIQLKPKEKEVVIKKEAITMALKVKISDEDIKYKKEEDKR